MIHILIADDHAIVRRGLRQLLTEDEEFDVIADVANAHDALQVLRKTHCDVVLLDMTMPQKHGLELLDDLVHEFPKLRILVLSMHSEEQFGIRALKAGAAGYLTKDGDPDLINKAIHKIVDGGKYITPQLAELLEFHLHHKSAPALHETLSTREFAVFLNIINGKSLTAIAEELSLSVKTVSNYRMRTLEKMNMKSNADLIHYAHRNGLAR
jgi:two-component system, NarL family, invasion response regulator UvrY